MESIVGIFNSFADVKRASAILRSLGIPDNRIAVLSPNTPEGAIDRIADSGEQAGGSSLVTLCQEPLVAEAQICSAFRNESGNLMLITWTDA